MKLDVNNKVSFAWHNRDELCVNELLEAVRRSPVKPALSDFAAINAVSM
jgi:hypothetical protein